MEVQIQYGEYFYSSLLLKTYYLLESYKIGVFYICIYIFIYICIYII